MTGPADLPAQKRHRHACIPLFLRKGLHQLLFYFFRLVGGYNAKPHGHPYYMQIDHHAFRRLF